MKLKIETWSNVYFKPSSTEVKIKTRVKAFAWIDNTGAKTEGTFFDRTVAQTMTMTVNGVGQVLFVEAGEPYDPGDVASGVDNNWLADINDTMNGIFKTGDQMVSFSSSTDNMLNEAITEYKESMSDFLKQGSTFCYPGGNAFAFKDAAFSKNLDLVSLLSIVVT